MNIFSKILTKDFLIREYITNKKSAIKIAKMVGCGFATVYRYLKFYNISIRIQSEAMEGKFKGQLNPNYGNKWTEVQKTKASILTKKAMKDPKIREKITANRCSFAGKNNPMFAVRRFGKASPNWKGGTTSLMNSIHSMKEYNNWRTQIFKRDNYTCQKCYKASIGNIEVHHIKLFKQLLSDFLVEYDQFSPIEDKETLIRLAMKWQPFWDINNGKTLCEDCHKEEHSNLNFNRNVLIKK